MSVKQIADKTNLPERTVSRIFSGETAHPYADTIDLIAKAFGCELGDIFADTGVIVATEQLIEIKENVDAVEAERNQVIMENETLKFKNAALSAEIEMLKKEIQYKDELLSLHNYYKAIISEITK